MSNPDPYLSIRLPDATVSPFVTVYIIAIRPGKPDMAEAYTLPCEPSDLSQMTTFTRDAALAFFGKMKGTSDER